MDLDKLRLGQQRPLIFAEGAGDLQLAAVFQIKHQMLVAHLHRHDGGKGKTGHAGGAAQGQQGVLLLDGVEQLIQHGKEIVGGSGLEQIGIGLHRIALHGIFRGGGEKNDLRIQRRGADLPGGLHAGKPGHQDIQQHRVVGGMAHGLQQVHGAAEKIEAEDRAAAGLVLAQQRGYAGQLFPVVVADGKPKHGSAPFPMK